MENEHTHTAILHFQFSIINYQLNLVPQHPIVVVEALEKTEFAFLEAGLLAPGSQEFVGLFVVDAAVGTAVEGDEQEGTRLFRLDEGQKGAGHAQQLAALVHLAQNDTGRQQKGVELATHDVGVQTEAGVEAQDLGSQGTVGIGDALGAVIATEGLVEAGTVAVVVQAGVDVLAVGVQADDFVLAGTDMKQGHPHPVVHTDHDILAAGTRLDDHFGFGALETSFGDAHTVALAQLVRLGT